MKKFVLLASVLGVFWGSVLGQPNEGDWQTRNSGHWSSDSVWQYYRADLEEWRDTTIDPQNLVTKQITILNGDSLFNNDYGLFFMGGTIDINGIFYNISGMGKVSNGTLNINGSLISTSNMDADIINIGSTGLFDNSKTGNWYNTAPTFGSCTFGGTIKYSSNGAQTISNLSGEPYNNLILSGTGLKTLESSGTTTVSGDFTVKTGSSVTIPSGGTLSISSASNNVFESGASLISLGTVSGTGASTIEVQRLVTEDAWHLISAPHSDYTMDDLEAENTIDVHNTSSHVALAYFNETTNSWVTSTSPSGNMSPGIGYLTGVSDPGATTLSFTGAPNFGNKTSLISIVNTNKGINAVGNPYTSALTVDAFIDANTSAIDASFNAIYTYNPGSNQYEPNYDTNGQDYIQSCQGFLLKADSDGGNISFTTAMQAHSTDAFYKKSASEENYSIIHLNINNGEKVSKTEIYFRENATTGLDRGKDFGIIKRSEAFNIYTKLIDDIGIDFITQSLPNSNFENLTIPVGIDFSNGGMLTFSTEIMNLPEECLVILEDRELGTFTDLKAPDSKYSVTLEANTSGTGRFFIHTFDAQTSIAEIDDLQNITIFAFDKEIIVQGEIAEKSNVKVYDLSGRLVKQSVLENGYHNAISASDLKEGIYIIHLQVGNKIKTSKLFLH